MTLLDSNTSKIIDSLKTTVLLIDSDYLIIFANSAAEEYLQISKNKIFGRSLLQLFENSSAIEQCLTRLYPLANPIVLKEIAISPQQDRREIVTCALNPVSNDVNDKIFASIELISESQLSLIETQHKQSDQPAQTSQYLVQGMAHEIKNPLGGIRGAAQLLSENLKSREDKDFINIILHETGRLADLVDRMSGYIKDNRMLPVNIHRILEHVYKLLTSDLTGSVVIKRDYDPSLPELNGSESALTQAFINLGLNALQAIDHTGMITFRSRLVFGTIIDKQQFKQTIRIDIQDTGPGVDEKVASTLFEPLVSTKNQGTGLGLSICKEIIGHHHGKIEYSSQPGQTVFSVFLPIIERQK